jgi:hypothetical protein
VGGNNNGRIDPGETVDLTATIKNIGGVDFTDLNTTLECNDAYITITDNAGYFGAVAVDSIEENTNDPYVVSTDASAPQGHLVDFRLIATDGAFVDTFDLSLVIGSYHYMIWNPDPTPTPGMTMHTLLTALGYTGIYSTTLNTENLEMYRTIFVCVGIYPSNYMINNGSQEATALVNYVNHSGNLYLEGGDVWYYDPAVGGYNFGPLFGILPRGDGSTDLYGVAGLSGTFTEGMNFSYAGQNNYIDHLGTTGTGFSILRNGSNTDTIGVANDAGTHSTVGASFELGGLVDGSGISTKAALLDSIMHFFGIDLTGIEDTTKIDVQNPVLQLTPNPFCNTIAIRYSVVDEGYPIHNLTVKIYDTSGRLVKSFRITPYALRSTLSWDGRDDQNRMVPDGIYFVHIKADQQHATAKIILVR